MCEIWVYERRVLGLPDGGFTNKAEIWTVFFGALALLVLLALEIVILFSFVESEVNPSQ